MISGQEKTRAIYDGCAAIGRIVERAGGRWEAFMSDNFPLGLFNHGEGANGAIWVEFLRRRNGA